ncbi:MAG: hypothetical protein ACI9JN_000283 [Bacteroidia bacterium]|jgi:hypothetical protein
MKYLWRPFGNVMKRVGLLLIPFSMFSNVFAEGFPMDSTSYSYINFSWVSLQDEADGTYFSSNPYHESTAYPYYSFFGKFTPSIAIGFSDYKVFKGAHFRLNHSVGFMYSNQSYQGIFNVNHTNDTTTGEYLIEADEMKTQVQKYFLYYQIESKINFLRYLYITPVLGFDLRFQHSINESSNSELLYRMGMYETGNQTLLNHARFHIKAGYSVGISFAKHFDFGFTLKRSLNQSLKHIPNSKWRSTQGGLFITYQFR